MSACRFLKFGPGPAYRATRPRAYLALRDGQTRTILGQDLVVGGEHRTLAEFEASRVTSG